MNDPQRQLNVLVAQQRAAAAEEAYWTERTMVGRELVKLRKSALETQIDRDRAQGEAFRALAVKFLSHLQKLDRA